MATVTVPQTMLTAEEFAERPDPGHPEELVRGRIAIMPPPRPRHGHLCNKVGRLLGNFAEAHQLGWVFNNDSGVITERAPDTVRGAAAAFYSYARLPKDNLPDHYPEVAPELVVEVRSPSERWARLLAKVAEYLEVGVLMVVVLDDEQRSAHVFTADGPQRVLTADDALTFPEILAGLNLTVRQVFE